MAVKKLIEVALPLDAINAACMREKSMRHGHPSAFHLWWARRPLAAARAVIWSSLVDDPSSHPELYPTAEEQRAERERLFRILERFVIWENLNDQDALTEAKHKIVDSVGNQSITLLDPFAGGGAIPLEAQRLGLEAYAQDLNPVAVAINKAMIEIPPLFYSMSPVNHNARQRFGISSWSGNTGLASDVEYYGNLLKERVFEKVKNLYPLIDVPIEQGGGKASVIAWLWTRSIKCPNPACSHEAPLVSSFDISKKRGKEACVEPEVKNGSIRFIARKGKSKQPGTMGRKGAICIHCGSTISFPYIREEAKNGRMTQQMMAIVAEGPKGRGRIYLSPTDKDIAASMVERPSDHPDGPISINPRDIRAQHYGIYDFADLFTNRQLSVLNAFSDEIEAIQQLVYQDAIDAGRPDDSIRLEDHGSGAFAYSEAIAIYLAFLVDQLANHCSSVCGWNAQNTQIRNTFSRQAIPMVWDFAESNPFSNSSGSYASLFDRMIKAFSGLPSEGKVGLARQFNAQSDNGLRGIVVSTDPPYYNNIVYADLSDFFYIWMRKSLRKVYPRLFDTMLVPKAEELVATPYRDNRGPEGARNFFEEGMFRTCEQLNKYAREDIPVTIYYAYKQSESTTKNKIEAVASTGWETMLTAIIKSGFSITGTWPMRTEKPGRTIGIGANALASSIILVCRKRPADAPMATRRDFVNALKRELKQALDKLQTSNIAPVDLAQSAIGPGIGVYSRFSKVLEADGTEMTVRSALQIINQELDLYFSDQDSDLDRESRFCVDLYTQYAFNEIRFGEADVLARAKNTSIEGIAAKGALSSAKGVVRLLGRDEIRDIPAPDFCWLFTQQLTHAMETGGNEACANLLKDIYDNRAENARALAYRLFTIADKKGWNQEAFAYNSLVVAWRDIESRAAQLKQETPEQTSFDF